MPFTHEHESSRVKRLTSTSRQQHERLDAAVKAAGTFTDRERYGRFLMVQQLFHRDVAALYTDARIGQLLPGVAGTGRLHRITQDLADLGITPPAPREQPRFDDPASEDLPTALGWLCVAEGSRLGAVILLKRAEGLGLSQDFGARHLAPHPEGTGAHWKAFISAFDVVDLSETEEERLIAGGSAAFARILGLVDVFLPMPESSGTRGS